MQPQLKMVISGGQTGTDEIALEIAHRLGLATGGYAPRGYRTEHGPNLELRDKYDLCEHPSFDYRPRTEMNILHSDATAVFGDVTSAGTKATIKLCQQHGKPVLLNPSVTLLTNFLLDRDVHTLNVAGNRASRLTPPIRELAGTVLEASLRSWQQAA